MTKHNKTEAAIIEATSMGKIEVSRPIGDEYTITVARDGSTTTSQYTLVGLSQELSKRAAELDWKKSELRLRRLDGSPPSTVDSLNTQIRTMTREIGDLQSAMSLMI